MAISKEETKKENNRKNEENQQNKRKNEGNQQNKKKNEGNQQNKRDEKKDQKKNDKQKKGEKKANKEYKPGMPSWMYDPCPHRVWTPKPGERDKSEPRGAGSPWNEPGRKLEDVKKEEEEKSKKKEEKAAQKRQKAREENQKKKEDEEKAKKEEEKKKKEKEKQKEEKKKEKEKKKKKEEDEKRKKQKEEREEKKKEEEKNKEDKQNKKDQDKSKEKGKKEKEPLIASYMYEPCPHKVYNPGPGEKDLAEPRGVGSPWYVPVKKKEDLEKEEAERQEEDNKKRKERSKQHQKEQREKERKEEEQRQKEEAKQRRREQLMEEKREQKRIEREERRKEREREEMEKYMGEGVSPDKTDFTPELMLMFDFISGIDEDQRKKRGEALQMRKEEIENEMESHLAKEAFTKDFRELVSTYVEAEWGREDKKLRELKRAERKRRKEIFNNMDPLAKDMIAEGTRFNCLYKGAMGIPESKKDKRGHGEPSVMEDMAVSRIMEQMDKLMMPQPTFRSLLTANQAKHSVM
ncbi:golgin subfamily A member 6-like protein 22 [Macrosteles quadrilineatus]|uniref:golgin subfamily A member 6-like protein 22 n=1 Tax=Macrosteles quadrilineatus TaxID=74068 RepID=UPI0023E1BB06|nr:golgin subfamily A member 6-like protein 22 [Macrosteles quadrilineatus]